MPWYFGRRPTSHGRICYQWMQALGYAWALSYMKSLLSENEPLDRRNNTVFCKRLLMASNVPKAWNGGVSVMNVILSKLEAKNETGFYCGNI